MRVRIKCEDCVGGVAHDGHGEVRCTCDSGWKWVVTELFPVYSFAVRDGWNQGCIFVGADTFDEALAFVADCYPGLRFEGDKEAIPGLWSEHRGVLEMREVLSKWRAGL
jgi:hypothetical protein